MAENLGALTTTFTPDPDCATNNGISVIFSSCDTSPCEWWVQGPFSTRGCYPDNYNPSVSSGVYYSPGVCPKGYTPGCVSRNTIATLTETIYTCCPIVEGLLYYTCSDSRWVPWQSTLGCTMSMSNDVFTFTDITVVGVDGTISGTTSTTRNEIGIGAYGIEVRFQAADLVSSLTSTSVTETSSLSLAAVPQTPFPSTSSPSAGNDANSPGNSGKIEVGAAVGIGIGSAVFVLIIAASCFLFVKKRKRVREENEKGGQMQDTQISSTPLQAPSELSEQWTAHQLSAGGFQERHELSASA